MAADVPAIIFIFKGGRRGKEWSQNVCFESGLLVLVEREVLQQIYHCFALVRSGSHVYPSMNPSLGQGKEGPTSHWTKGYPQPPEYKIGILLAWKKEGDGCGKGWGGALPLSSHQGCFNARSRN